jgi:hypothetical protein
MAPWRILLCWLLPAGLTSVWCGRDENTLLGLALALAVLGLVCPAGVWVSRRIGGHTSRSLLAVGQLTLLVFLMSYLVCARVLQHTW